MRHYWNLLRNVTWVCFHTFLSHVTKSRGNTGPVTSTSLQTHIFLANPSRRFVFTWNNPPRHITEEDFKEYGMKYLSYQEERGENGTLHFQGYIEMPKPVRRTHFRPFMLKAHFDKARGTPQEADDYTAKEATRVSGPYRFGERQAGQGTRSDILCLRDAIRDGKRGRELYDDDGIAAHAIRFGRAIEQMAKSYRVAVSRDDIHVVLHYGPPGTGKSHCAVEPGCCILETANGFWINYNGESHVVLDEFGGHVMSPLQFQRLCDVYPLAANVKGSSEPANVIISIYIS